MKISITVDQDDETGEARVVLTEHGREMDIVETDHVIQEGENLLEWLKGLVTSAASRFRVARRVKKPLSKEDLIELIWVDNDEPEADVVEGDQLLIVQSLRDNGLVTLVKGETDSRGNQQDFWRATPFGRSLIDTVDKIVDDANVTRARNA